MHRKRPSATVALFTVLTLLLSACVRPVTISGTPAGGEVTFTYTEGQVIGTMDPAKHVDESSMHAVINIYDPLLYPNQAAGTMESVPHVAEKWEASPDGKTYTFTLRKGVKFHDGTELTAEDVAFSMQRMLAIKKGFSWLYQGIVDRVEAKDSHTVVFHLTKPHAPFLGSLQQFFIVNKKLCLANKQAGEFGDNGDYCQAYLEQKDAGSGPYIPVKYDRSSEMVLEQFKDYWRGWKPGQITKGFYKIVEEEATQKTMIKSGQSDMTHQWLTNQSFEELAATKGIVVQTDPSVQLYHMPINAAIKPTNNIHIRRMLAYAFDYDTAVKTVFAGGVKAIGPVPVKVPGHNSNIVRFPHDMAKAKAELQASGLSPADVRLTFLFPGGGGRQEQTGLMLQAKLKELGVSLEVKGVPWQNITEGATKPETTPHLAGIFDTLKYPHIDSHTYGMYHPGAKGSYRSMQWEFPDALTALLDRARATVDPAAQMDLYRESQAKIAEQVYSIYVANPAHRIAFRDYVKGYRYVGLLGFDVALYDFTIEK